MFKKKGDEITKSMLFTTWGFSSCSWLYFPLPIGARTSPCFYTAHSAGQKGCVSMLQLGRNGNA